MGLLGWIDLAGVAVFAASGALVASRKRMDLVGFALVATVTGIGGGTLRDVLLDRRVFWLDAPHYLWLCAGVAGTLFLAAPFVQRRYPVLLWADAAGLAVFATLGARVALDEGFGATISVLTGIMTATFGGLIRDVLCGEIPLILRREIYATAAAIGAGTYVALAAWWPDLAPGLSAGSAAGPVPGPAAGASPGISSAVAALGGIGAGFAARAAGIGFGLSLPVYRAREGRDYPPERPPERPPGQPPGDPSESSPDG